MLPTSRRRLLSTTVSLTLAAAAEKAASGETASPEHALNVVICGGHPGDPEYGCGGTAARFSELGHRVTLLYLNKGQKTCPEQPGDPGSSTRTAEAQKACSILKAQAAFAGQCDAHSVVDGPHYEEFHSVLAALKPDILFTHWPLDGHRDHRAAAMLAYDSWLRLKKTFALFFYEVSDGEDTQMFNPDRYVDISQTEGRKREACYAHASQSPDRYYALQSQVARFRGLTCGCQQAEAFIEHVGGPRVELP